MVQVEIMLSLCAGAKLWGGNGQQVKSVCEPALSFGSFGAGYTLMLISLRFSFASCRMKAFICCICRWCCDADAMTTALRERRLEAESQLSSTQALSQCVCVLNGD